MQNVRQTFTSRVKGTWLRFGAVAATFGAEYYVADDIDRWRGRLPLDFANHAHNIPGSLVAGVVGGALVGKLSAAEGESPRALRYRLRAGMAAGGLLVGGAINVVAEAKLGHNFDNTTGDIVDFLYGFVSAGIAGALAGRIVTEPSEQTGQ